MKFNQVLSNFSAGEWSPKMKGRTDVQQYANACEKLFNVIPQLQGGAFRRPPTNRVILDSTSNTDLQSISGNSAINAKLIPYKGADGSGSIIFAPQTAPSTTWFWIDADSPTAGGSTFIVSSGADGTFLPHTMDYVQVGDYLFLAYNDTVKGKIPKVINKNVFFYINTMADVYTSRPWITVPYLPVNALGSSVNMTAGAATGATTLTASAAYFVSTMVGSYFKLSSAASTGVVKVTGFTSSTVVDVTVLSTVPTATVGTAAGTSWEESAWSDYRGWPRTVTAYQGRLIYGGTDTYPDTIWGSRIGNVFDFMERPFEQSDSFDGYAVDNSRPFTLSPNSNEASSIRALSSAKTLLVHTDRAEIVVYGTQGALGPNDVTFESSTSFGAAAVMPTRTNNYSVFVEKGNRKLRDVIFNFNEDQYKSSDLTFVSDHLTVDPESTGIDQIYEIHGANLGTSVVFAKTLNGRLLCLALDRDYQINAWSLLQFSGISSDREHPVVKAVASVELEDGAQRTFFIVNRRINGSNLVTMEYMDPQKEDAAVVATLKDYFYADLRFEYRYLSGNRNFSLDHLKGETVEVMADGQYRGAFVVDSSGELTLGATYTTIWAGLKYESIIKTMPVEIGQQVPGSPQGFVKRIDEITVKFWNSRGAQYGSAEDDLITIDFKDPVATTGNPPELFTGFKKLKFDGGYSEESQVVIKQDKPWPCNVLSIVQRGVLFD